MLGWFFYHFAYSSNVAVSQPHFEAYLRELAKPWALRGGINYYASVWKDAQDTAVLRERPL